MGAGRIPFLYVEKPSGEGLRPFDPADTGHGKAAHGETATRKRPRLSAGIYRDTHIRIMQYPQTRMVTSTDLGNMTHPPTNPATACARTRARWIRLWQKWSRSTAPFTLRTKSRRQSALRFTHVGQGIAPAQADQAPGLRDRRRRSKIRLAEAVIDATAWWFPAPVCPSPRRPATSGRSRFRGQIFSTKRPSRAAFRTDALDR